MSKTKEAIENDSGVDAAIEWDGAQASAPIVYIEDGERFSTPFQTADAAHDMARAKAMVWEWVGSAGNLTPA